MNTKTYRYRLARCTDRSMRGEEAPPVRVAAYDAYICNEEGVRGSEQRRGVCAAARDLADYGTIAIFVVFERDCNALALF
jgi:hypothetical protein